MASAKGIRAGRAFVELFADDSKLVRGLRRAEKTELPKARLIGWLGVGRGKFYDRAGPYGQVNEHNAPVPLDLGQARRLIGRFVEHYNTRRLHSAIGYITPADKLAGRSEGLWSSRERKLSAARLARQQARANNRLGELEVSLHPR
jgi:transposase InsO family protein